MPLKRKKLTIALLIITVINEQDKAAIRLTADNTAGGLLNPVESRVEISMRIALPGQLIIILPHDFAFRRDLRQSNPDDDHTG